MDKDENRKLIISDYIDIFRNMIESKTSSYIVIETANTLHHIERLSTSVADRGRYKWSAEMKASAYVEVALNLSDEAKRSHIDEADCFPRYFYMEQSLINEVFQFIIVRGLSIINIVAPKF